MKWILALKVNIKNFISVFYTFFSVYKYVWELRHGIFCARRLLPVSVESTLYKAHRDIIKDTQSLSNFFALLLAKVQFKAKLFFLETDSKKADQVKWLAALEIFIHI